MGKPRRTVRCANELCTLAPGHNGACSFGVEPLHSTDALEQQQFEHQLMMRDVRTAFRDAKAALAELARIRELLHLRPNQSIETAIAVLQRKGARYDEARTARTQYAHAMEAPL